MNNKLLINFFDNREMNKNLKELLEVISKNDIEVVNYFFGIKKKMKKRDLIEFIYSKLTNKEYLISLIGSLLSDEIKVLKNIIKNNGEVVVKEKDLLDFSYLTSLFVIDTVKKDDKLIMYMTDDVYNILKDIDIKKYDNSKINDKVKSLLFSMVNYYGVVSLDDIVDTYRKYYNEELEINDALFKLEFRVEHVSYYSNEDNEYFINSGFYDFDKQFVELVIKRQKEFDRPEIELDELLKYEDINYIDYNDSTLEYKDFLKTKLDDDLLEDLIAYTQSSLRFSINEIYTIADSLNAYGVEFSQSELYTFMGVITKIYDHIAIYVNNGWNSIDFIKEFGKDNYIDLLDLGAKEDECSCSECDGSCHEEGHECHCHDDKKDE